MTLMLSDRSTSKLTAQALTGSAAQRNAVEAEVSQLDGRGRSAQSSSAVQRVRLRPRNSSIALDEVWRQVAKSRGASRSQPTHRAGMAQTLRVRQTEPTRSPTVERSPSLVGRAPNPELCDWLRLSLTQFKRAYVRKI